MIPFVGIQFLIKYQDSRLCHFHIVTCPCGSKRLQRRVVYLCLSVSDSFLFYYSNQVGILLLCHTWSLSQHISSLRVNLDMGKTVYAHHIMNDHEIPNTIVRTSTLPEELGRITYLVSDKTGVLTQNEMEMRKLHMGTMSYGTDSMDEMSHQLLVVFGALGKRGTTGNLRCPLESKCVVENCPNQARRGIAALHCFHI